VDDKYIPWFILPIIIGFGILGYLLYKSMMKEQPLPLPLRPLQPVPNSNILQTLQSIDSNIYNQIPVGEHEIRNVNVTSLLYDLYDEASNGLNWISAQICNNGPNNVYCSVNNWENPEAPIVPGQCQSINLMKKAAIKRIFFKCNTGNTASVYVYGMK
jgi:hypothetical protein